MTSVLPAAIATQGSTGQTADTILPTETWTSIIKKLGFWDQVAVSRVCWVFREIVERPDFEFTKIKLETRNEYELILSNNTIAFKKLGRLVTVPNGQGINQQFSNIQVQPETDPQQLERVTREVQAHLLQRKLRQALPNNLFTLGQLEVRKQQIIIRQLDATIPPPIKEDFPLAPDPTEGYISAFWRSIEKAATVIASVWRDIRC